MVQGVALQGSRRQFKLEDGWPHTNSLSNRHVTGLALYPPCRCSAPSTQCLKASSTRLVECRVFFALTEIKRHEWQFWKPMILSSEAREMNSYYSAFCLTPSPMLSSFLPPFYQVWLCKHSVVTKTHKREGLYSDILLKSRLTCSVMVRAVRLKNWRGKLGRH